MIETATNLPDTVNVTSVLNAGVISPVIEFTKKTAEVVTKGKKGRPVLHKFAGRITFLRTEVEWALQNGDAFIELMQSSHKLEEERRAILLSQGILTDNIEMYYTFQGPIEMVLEEMQAVTDRYANQINEGTASIRHDFHKVRTCTNTKDPTYVAPVTEQVGSAVVTTQIEVVPDKIYGYVKVILTQPANEQVA